MPQNNNYHKKWYFFITDLFNFSGHKQKQKVVSVKNSNYNNNNSFIQKDPDGIKISVSVENIGKNFKVKGKDIKVLKSITFNAFYDEIFAILGHNGAGKTTLMNIMTGILSASHGEIYFDGIPINGNETEISKKFGYCPQFDTLNNNLTVGEHVKLFAGIKNVKVDVDTTLKEIDLLEKKNTFPKKLSGGQKRKLCITLALLGSPKYVFLDEATTGLDPYSRKNIWELLLKKKKNCTMFITTHYMDEADLLADRKMIISNGITTCLGTSLFLKNCFNMNYILDIYAKDSKDCSLPDQTMNEYCPGSVLTKSITTTNGNVSIYSPSKGEEGSGGICDEYIISYLLPIKYSSVFECIFESLNKIIKDNSNTITNFTLTAPTLEDLFIKLESSNDKIDNRNINININGMQQKNNNSNRDDQIELLKHTTTININQDNLHSNLDPIFSKTNLRRKPSTLIQIYEIVKLRLILFFRNKTFAMLYTFLPICFIILSIYFSNSSTENRYSGNIKTYEPMIIVPSIYENVRWFKNSAGSNGQALEIIQNIERNNPKIDIDTVDYVNQLSLDTIQSLPGSTNFIGGFTGTVDPQNNLQFIIHTNHTYSYSAAIAINIIDNAILDYYKINERISTTYHPLDEIVVYGYDKYDEENMVSREKERDRQTNEPIIIIAVALAISLSISIYGPYTVKEREEGITYQLYLNGTKRLNYWIGILIGDSICILIPVIFLSLACFLFDISIFNKKIVLYVVMVTLPWILGSLLHQYIVGYFFKIYEKFSNLMIIINPILTFGIGIYAFSIINEIARLSNNEFYSNENKKIRYLYLYDIYFILFLYTPAAILLIFLKIYCRIYNLKFDIGEYEIINFLNSTESIKITSRNDISHKEKSNIITKMFFDDKTPNFYVLMNQKEHFISILITSIVVVIVFSLILIILEKCKMKYIQQNRNYTEEERKIKNKQLESGPIDVYNEWKRVKQSLEDTFNNNSYYNNISNNSFSTYDSITRDNNNSKYSNCHEIIKDHTNDKHSNNSNIALKVFQINKDVSIKKKDMKKKMNQKQKEKETEYKVFKNGNNNKRASKIKNKIKFKKNEDLTDYSNNDNMNKYLGSIEIHETDESNSNAIINNNNKDIKNNDISAFEKMDNRITYDPNQKKYLNRIVDDVTFGVNVGECLGLLGPNGAGKTTSISMITGLMSRTHGKIIYGEKDLNETEIGNLSLGYCAQHNSLWKLLTVKETIQFYLRIAGYRNKDVNNYTKALINACGIENHTNKKIGEISGGTKRKVSLIIAICSSPSYLILDEPSAGMDPFTRRYMWKLITELKKIRETATILTTHSTEEAEALCNRIAILIKGRLVCVDTPKSIKMNHSDKYVLEVFTDYAENFEQQIVRKNNLFGLEKEMDYELESSVSYQKYSVKMKTENIAKVFSIMEKLVKDGLVTQYNFGQFSLEQVFIEFVNNTCNNK